MKILVWLSLLFCLVLPAVAQDAPASKMDKSNEEITAQQPAPEGWWPAAVAPWVGGIGGPLIGCGGGLLGWLAGKGKARRLVLTLWKGFIAAGIICLILTGIAFAQGQPEYIIQTLLIFGIVTTVVFSVIWPQAKKRYNEVEMRRMAAIDGL